MDMYIPLKKAARIVKKDPDLLYQDIAAGMIRAIKAAGSEILVNEKDLYHDLPKEERPEYKKYAHLCGVKILASEASRRYGVSTQSISNWVKAGYIKMIERSTKRVWIDEADIAYCAEVYKSNPGQGKWLFNSDGTPYNKK